MGSWQMELGGRGRELRMDVLFKRKRTHSAFTVTIYRFRPFTNRVCGVTLELKNIWQTSDILFFFKLFKTHISLNPQFEGLDLPRKTIYYSCFRLDHNLLPLFGFLLSLHHFVSFTPTKFNMIFTIFDLIALSLHKSVTNVFSLFFPSDVHYLILYSSLIPVLFIDFNYTFYYGRRFLNTI